MSPPKLHRAPFKKNQNKTDICHADHHHVSCTSCMCNIRIGCFAIHLIHFKILHLHILFNPYPNTSGLVRQDKEPCCRSECGQVVKV